MENGYKDLIVWQKSMELTEEIYKVTSNFPNEEKYGLTSQIRRSAVSIPSNIAEGSRRKGKDSVNFLRIAFGSGSELETQIELSRRLNFIPEDKYNAIVGILSEVMKMLNKMIYR